MVRKLLGVRMFPDIDRGKRWDKSVKDLGLEILCVSQVSFICFVQGEANKLLLIHL